MSLFPKEHGAYGQLIAPLATSYILAGADVPGLLLGGAVVAAFLAHEPLLVILGRRGRRAHDELKHRATAWLVVTLGLALLAGIGAYRSIPAPARWSIAVPVAAGAVLAGALIAKQEKSAIGELAVASTFSSVAIPVCLAAGASLRTAITIALVFAAVFVADTLAVRVVILAVRGGGNPGAMQVTRVAALVFVCAAVIGLVFAASRALLPWVAPLAAAPGLAAAAYLAIVRPAATGLRRVGWTLVGTSVIAAAILAFGLDRR